MFKTENFFMKEAYTSKMGWQRFDILNHVIYESEDEVKFLERFMGQFEIYKITQNVRINIIFSNAVNMFAKDNYYDMLKEILFAIISIADSTFDLNFYKNLSIYSNCKWDNIGVMLFCEELREKFNIMDLKIIENCY